MKFAAHRRIKRDDQGRTVRASSASRNRQFESTSLQRRVACEPKDNIDIPPCPASGALPYLRQLNADVISFEFAPRAICAGERFSARRGSAAPALCESRAPSVLRS